MWGTSKLENAKENDGKKFHARRGEAASPFAQLALAATAMRLTATLLLLGMALAAGFHAAPLATRAAAAPAASSVSVRRAAPIPSPEAARAAACSRADVAPAPTSRR